MVFTAAQTAAFFEQADQMCIPRPTVNQLAVEGIVTVQDLEEFDDDSLDTLSANLRKPAGTMPDPNDPNRVVPLHGFVFGAKSLKQLKVAAKAVRYYVTVGRELTPANMNHSNVLQTFDEEWKSLELRRKEDTPSVPKINPKSSDITRWTESFGDFLHKVVGVRYIPLSYVIRESAAVGTAPPLINHKPYSDEHGSVQGELIARASHGHPLYRDDNEKVYGYLEEATRNTMYCGTLKPHQRRRDGRGAWLALISQFAGRDKWEAELKCQQELMINRVWKGNNNWLLEKFVQMHRNAYLQMQRCAEHVPFQLPNERTRVTHLLNNMQCSDASLQAAMALVKADEHGRMTDFESAVSYLIPYDPVAKKHAATRSKSGNKLIADVSLTDGKESIGKTGVHLRYHTPEEYSQLSKDQKEELYEWRSKTGNDGTKKRKGKGQGKGSPSNDKSGTTQQPTMSKKKIKAAVASAIAQALKSQDSAANNGKDEVNKDLVDAIVSSITSQKQPVQPPPPQPSANASAVTTANGVVPNNATIQSILRNSKVRVP
jgi:hypothetical protein